MTAASQGFSPERLARIDRFLAERYVEPGRLPGIQFVLARGGEVVHQTLLGQRDRERNAPLTEDTIFRIYSMTKPITSVAFMMLVEEGLVALDDPVSRYIPEWSRLEVTVGGALGSFKTRKPEREMLVVDLLRHTSGLTYGIQQRTHLDAAYRNLGIAQLGDPLALDVMIATLAGLPLEFSPGEAWNYSISTDVLGWLVEVISGRPFDAFLRERILGPLKMVDTDFHVSSGQGKRLAACYAVTPEGGLKLQDDPTTSEYLAPPHFVSGGGGLVSTAADYLRFAQMLLNGGELDGVRLLAPKTVALMSANHLPDGKDLTQLSQALFSESTSAGIGFGLGFSVVIDPAKTLIPCSAGEIAWGGAASTAFWVDPKEELTAVLMTQALPSSSYPIRRELRTLVYSALMRPNG